MNQIYEFMEFIEGAQNLTLSSLLDRVLHKTREMTGAEAGTIFLIRNDGPSPFLEPGSLQNDRIAVEPATFTVPVGPGTVAGYVAHANDKVLIDDVYEIPDGAPYGFSKAFDEKSGYRTHSMFAFPLNNFRGQPIAVVQLINCLDPATGETRPFQDEQKEIVQIVNHFAGNAIERVSMIEEINLKNQRLEQRNKELDAQRAQIGQLQQETEDAFMVSVRLLSRASGIHDNETFNHVQRVREYSLTLGALMGMSQEFLDELGYSSELHDVGKLIVDPKIFKKPGRLTDEEFVEMKRHTSYGFQILKDSERLSMAAHIARHHHEKWDGTGYPMGLAGEDIPLPARIVAIADVYDALRSPRFYKPAFSHEKTVDIMTKGDDRLKPEGHFDPALLTIFAEHHGRFLEIYETLADHPEGETAVEVAQAETA